MARVKIEEIVGPASASRARLQPRQFHADPGAATSDGALVADHAPGEAGQDRREDGPPWQLRHLPDGRGRRLTADVRADSGPDRPPACAAGAGLTRTAVDMDGKAMGEVCFGDGKTEVER